MRTGWESSGRGAGRSLKKRGRGEKPGLWSLGVKELTDQQVSQKSVTARFKNQLELGWTQQVRKLRGGGSRSQLNIITLPK